MTQQAQAKKVGFKFIHIVSSAGLIEAVLLAGGVLSNFSSCVAGYGVELLSF